jgi:hypothetical protein
MCHPYVVGIMVSPFLLICRPDRATDMSPRWGSYYDNPEYIATDMSPLQGYPYITLMGLESWCPRFYRYAALTGLPICHPDGVGIMVSPFLPICRPDGATYMSPRWGSCCYNGEYFATDMSPLQGYLYVTPMGFVLL